MRRFFALLMMLGFMVSLAAGTATRATAPIPCATLEQVAGEGVHYDGDADEVAADDDGGFPHHHGIGHDHGVGLADTHRAVSCDAPRSPKLAPGRQTRTVGTVVDPALRPPTA